MTGSIDVLVIGAGQAGLAAGFHLQRAGLEFRIVDGAERIGDSWRRRYESLTLFTPRSLSHLPGLPLPGDQDGYPSRDEFASYLEAYASKFCLPVATGADVTSLEPNGEGFRALLADGTSMACSSVIVASGGFQRPVRPAIAPQFDESIVQLDPESYRNPAGVPPGRVLVVGDGASGRDIALELAATRETLLAVGKPRKLIPGRILGRSTWWWLDRLGLMRMRPESLAGRWMRRSDPFPNRGIDLGTLRRLGVRIMPRLSGAQGRQALFVDQRRTEIEAVIWATGYIDDMDWLQVPGALGYLGSPVHRDGVSPVPHLYYVGRPWQRSRSSALVMGVGEDARRIVEQLVQDGSRG